MGVKTRNLGNSEGKDIQWQAPLNADGSTIFNLEAGKGYFINTTGGEVELKLPTGSLGDRISIVDFAGTFATNVVRINLNGQKLNGSTNPSGGGGATNYVLIETNNTRLDLVFSDSDKGWMTTEFEAKSSPTGAPFSTYTAATGGTVITDGDFKIHVFTGDGCFVTTTVGNASGGGVGAAYLVVAGGGGPSFDAGGGGGAGGFREGKAGYTFTASPLAAACGVVPLAASTTYPITVGAGASARTNPQCGYSGAPSAQTGSNSVFSTITSAGGGAAQGNQSPYGSGTASTAGSGGSGGGLHRNGPGPLVGGLGNTPPVSPPQGQNGGGSPSGTGNGSAGGGGAGQAGTNLTSSPPAGAGGNGVPTTFIPGTCHGTPGSNPGRYFAGGGGGGYDQPGGVGGVGGEGGGGRGGGRNPAPQPEVGVAGTANTGGGGGGMGAGNPTRAGGAGGKGIVAIRYKFQN